MLTMTETTYLGPAVVLSAAGKRIKLELPDEHAWAVCALAFPYQPAEGDVVLAAGRSGVWYVIGVLKGSGTTTLTVPGDLQIRAPQGQITLAAARGVELRGDEVRISSNRFELLTRRLFERCVEATRWVKEALQIRAGRLRTRVEGCYDLAAEQIVERADQDVRIDGDKIHLG